jgi:hypothetical protein
MMILALSIIHFQGRGIETRLKAKEWSLFISGSLIIILSFIWDYLHYINKMNTSNMTNSLGDHQSILSEIKDYVPVDFNWGLFLSGESILLYGIIIFIIKKKKYALLSNTKLTKDII